MNGEGLHKELSFGPLVLFLYALLMIPAGCGLLCAAESLAAVVLGFVFGFDARFLYS